MTWICDQCGKSREQDAMFPFHLPGYTPAEGRSWEYLEEAHLCDDCYVKFRELLGK